MPKIRKFTDYIDVLERSHETMRECIRKFDDDLTLKANKSALIVLQNEIQQ